MNEVPGIADKEKIITKSAQETEQAGRILAEEIIKGRPKEKQALVIALEGELGSGKTTFTQGLARGLEVKEKVTSPTFVIFKKFELNQAGIFECFYHVDCYRLSSARDLTDLDFKEIINQPTNLVVIEWAEKIKEILPAEVSWFKFEYLTENERKIVYENFSSY